MYEHYWVIDRCEDIVGDAWFDNGKHCYTATIPIAGIEHDFENFEEMVHYLLVLGFDAV